MVKPKIKFWDLETTNLNADFGYIICGGIYTQGEKKPKVYSVLDYPKSFGKDCTNDKELVARLKEELEDADLWVTWFGSYFDIPYLNTRLAKHGLSPIRPANHVDGWKIARTKMRLHSNRLDSVSKFLGVEEKTPIKGDHWVRASAGNKDSIKYVIEHCYQDVVVLPEVYEKIAPFMNNGYDGLTYIPNYSLMSEQGGLRCMKCGSDKLRMNGWRYAKVNRARQYQCLECGKWGQGKNEPLPDKRKAELK